VHPDVSGRYIFDAVFELPERDVDSAVEMAGFPFVGSADVERDHPVAGESGFEVFEGGDLVARRAAFCQGVGGAGGGAGQVDADTDELALGFGDLGGAVTDESERGSGCWCKGW
jgi:hypothetical protein